MQLLVAERRGRCRRRGAAAGHRSRGRRAAAASPGRARAGAAAPPQPHSLEIRNPATGASLRSVAVTEDGEIAQKVARRPPRAARRGRPGRTTERAARAARVPRSARRARLEECARVTTSEVGKPIAQSRNEVRAVLERIEWNVAHVGDVIAPRTVTERRPSRSGSRTSRSASSRT